MVDLGLSEKVVNEVMDNIRGDNVVQIRDLAEITGISEMELLEALNPFLFLGILRYDNHRIEGWGKLREGWAKI